MTDLEVHQEFRQWLVHDGRAKSALSMRVALMAVLKKYFLPMRHLGVAEVQWRGERLYLPRSCARTN
jgi:hypothetical protein